MLTIKCESPTTMLLSEMTPFQGDLKKRSAKDVDGLIESLTNDGLIMPFAIWKNANGNFILDGHGRREAIMRMMLSDSSLASQVFPTIEINAATEEDARKALLQISSNYGKVTKQGAINFTRTIPNYRAPSIKSIYVPVVKAEKKVNDYIIIRLRVKKDIVSDIANILKDVNGVEVL